MDNKTITGQWTRTPNGKPMANNLMNQLMCGDSAKMMQVIPDESIALIVTSPPYWDLVDYGVDGQIGMGDTYDDYIDKLHSVWVECQRVLIPNGKLAIVAPIVPVPKNRSPENKLRHTRQLLNIASDIEQSIVGANYTEMLSPYSLFVWQKQTTTKMFGSYPYPPNIYEDNTIEFINVYVKSGKPPQMLDKSAKDNSKLTQPEWVNLTQQVWCLYPENVQRAQHPAPFPVALPLRLIKMYTYASSIEHNFVGDVVLDPFMGSGSTILAAKATGRNYIGVDLSQSFCDIASSRLNNEQCNPDAIFLQIPKVKGATTSL